MSTCLSSPPSLKNSPSSISNHPSALSFGYFRRSATLSVGSTGASTGDRSRVNIPVVRGARNNLVS
uniref:Uncharacterized protein n=1 Tax=Medicago truncatula TaxID=3880 RepID=I3SE76_MEDTR|nr:unknown [Medicago truncatula]